MNACCIQFVSSVVWGVYFFQPDTGTVKDSVLASLSQNICRFTSQKTASCHKDTTPSKCGVWGANAIKGLAVLAQQPPMLHRGFESKIPSIHFWKTIFNIPFPLQKTFRGYKTPTFTAPVFLSCEINRCFQSDSQPLFNKCICFNQWTPTKSRILVWFPCNFQFLSSLSMFVNLAQTYSGLVSFRCARLCSLSHVQIP